MLNEDLQYYLGGNLKTRKSTLGTSILTEQMVFDGLNHIWKWTPERCLKEPIWSRMDIHWAIRSQPGCGLDET